MTPKTLDKYIAALKKKAAAEGWSEAEYKKELNNYYFDFADQYNAGKITFAEMAAVQKKINNAEKSMALQGKTAQTMKPDPGQQAADDTVLKLEKELKKVYGQASKEIQADLDGYLKKFGPEIKDLEMKFIDGTITEDRLNESVFRILSAKMKVTDWTV